MIKISRDIFTCLGVTPFSLFLSACVSGDFNGMSNFFPPGFVHPAAAG